MPDPAEAASGPNRDSTTTEATEAQQLALRFFAVVDAHRGVPPDRALWRIQLDTAVPRVATAAFRATAIAVAGRPVSPAVVITVAWVVYSLADTAGLSREPQHVIAHHARIDRKTAQAAIDLLEYWKVIQRRRPRRRSAEILALNLGGLAWDMVRRRLRRRREAPKPEARPLFPLAPVEASGGTMPPLRTPSGGMVPPLMGVRTEEITTTTAREARPAATDVQRAFAEDLGIDPTGKDLVELGLEIEQARTARAAERAAAGKNGQQRRPPLTAIERRRLSEARRWSRRGGADEEPAPAPETAEQAHARLQAGLDRALGDGYRRAPDDPDVLIAPNGVRFWCASLAQIDGRAAAPALR